MNKKRIIVSIIIMVILFSIAMISIFVIADKVSDPEFHKKSMEILNNKKMIVAKLTGTAAAASVAISAIPGDATTSIANEIMDMASYFLLITGVIFLEELLLTMTGLIAFKFIIPASCCLGIIFIFWKNETIKNLAMKLTAFGILVFIIVPISVYISSWIENNYQDKINVPIDNVENIEISEEQEETKQEEEGFFAGLKNRAKDVAENLATGVSKSIEKAEQTLNKFIDAIAVLVITTCVIPILVLVFFIWIIKIIFGISINIPVNKIVKRKKDANIEVTKETDN